jgi:hypothetical protein
LLEQGGTVAAVPPSRNPHAVMPPVRFLFAGTYCHAMAGRERRSPTMARGRTAQPHTRPLAIFTFRTGASGGAYAAPCVCVRPPVSACVEGEGVAVRAPPGGVCEAPQHGAGLSCAGSRGHDRSRPHHHVDHGTCVCTSRLISYKACPYVSGGGCSICPLAVTRRRTCWHTTAICCCATPAPA